MRLKHRTLFLSCACMANDTGLPLVGRPGVDHAGRSARPTLFRTRRFETARAGEGHRDVRRHPAIGIGDPVLVVDEHP